jgi:hypothetical protein
VAGKAALEKVDLEPGLKVLRDQLMTKNVVCMVENHVFRFGRDSFMAPCVALSLFHPYAEGCSLRFHSGFYSKSSSLCRYVI